MIGKIVTGKSFGGAVRYLLGKEPGKAYILTSDGVELTSRQALIGSFEFQRRARPDVKRIVGHISRSFHPNDDPRMSDQLMLDLARVYMRRMDRDRIEAGYVVRALVKWRGGTTARPYLWKENTSDTSYRESWDDPREPRPSQTQTQQDRPRRIITPKKKSHGPSR